VVDAIESPSNFQHTTADEDDLQIANLIEEPLQYTNEDITRVRSIALAEPFFSTIQRLYNPGPGTMRVPS